MSSTIGRQLRMRQKWIEAREKKREPLIVVHEITETWGINDGQTEANAVLFNICCSPVE